MAQPPTARRITRPKWLDIRVIGGVLLLVVSVAVGSKVVGAASRTSPVWAAAHDLAAGTVLAPGDLSVADVNLGEHGAAYVDSASELDGRVINRPLTAGELLPAAAVDPVDAGRIVSLAVTPAHMAPDIAHGSVVDVYLVTGRAAVSSEPVTTRRLISGVTVQSVIAPASGGLSGAVSRRYQVALLLSAAEADAVVKQLPLGEPVMVRHTGDDRAADSGR